MAGAEVGKDCDGDIVGVFCGASVGLEALGARDGCGSVVGDDVTGVSDGEGVAGVD